jgi:hypothetical protein
MAAAEISALNRLNQVLLVASTLLAFWLGMQAVHESGHVFGAWLTGDRVERVVLHPLTISRTELALNPRPLVVAWAGPIVGVVVPLLFWGLAHVFCGPRGGFARLRWFLRFFAGFCLIANGLYIGLGSFGAIGDCGDLLRQGSQPWQLWLFGLITAPLGLYFWHGLGPRLGFAKLPASIPDGTWKSSEKNED